MTTTRQLAAILAADDAGYSRLFGAGEGGTLVDGHQSRRHCQVDILADLSRPRGDATAALLHADIALTAGA